MKFLTKILVVLNLLFISVIVLSLIPVYGINKEVDPYYEYAMNIIRDNCKEGEYSNPKYIKVDFAETLNTKGAIGQCLNLGFRYEITIKTEYWNRSAEQERYSLIMHEVAHCALGMPHSEDESNYMYFQDNYLDLATVTNQFISDVLVTCSQKRRH
jgi:hypothetical protein